MILQNLLVIQLEKTDLNYHVMRAISLKFHHKNPRKSGLEKGQIDIVIGGPPCQSFSTAGMRKGLDDKEAWHYLNIFE